MRAIVAGRNVRVSGKVLMPMGPWHTLHICAFVLPAAASAARAMYTNLRQWR
jgi:ribosomal protein L1